MRTFQAPSPNYNNYKQSVINQVCSNIIQNYDTNEFGIECKYFKSKDDCEPDSILWFLNYSDCKTWIINTLIDELN